MIDGTIDASAAEAFEALKTRAEALERRLQETEDNAQTRIRQFELKAEAVRAGIVDLDGLRLISAHSEKADSLESPAEVINKLRRDKPWLFGGTSSSSVAVLPSATAVKRKLATEMTVEEWRAARADLLRRR